MHPSHTAINRRNSSEGGYTNKPSETIIATNNTEAQHILLHPSIICLKQQSTLNSIASWGLEKYYESQYPNLVATFYATKFMCNCEIK